MDRAIIQKLFEGTEVATGEDAINLLLRAGTNPDAARTLWQSLLSNNTADERLEMALRWILESAIIDQIANRISGDDEYAVVIGRRINTLIEKIALLSDSQFANTA